MGKKKLKAYIILSISTFIFFFAVFGFLIFGMIKQNNFVVYTSVIGLPVVSFLTSFFITQAVKIKNDAEKNAQEDNGKN